MNPILGEIVRRTGDDLAERKNRDPLADLEARALRSPPPRSFATAVRAGGGVGLIAELKAKSPSAGLLRDPYDVGAGARAYARAGARALSILTEPHYFGGRLEDLGLARSSCPLPVLRKDFIINPYQVVEARAHGADAVLLIARIITEDALAFLLVESKRWGLEALVEVHEEEEIEQAVRAGAEMIGINSRNLDTLAMDPEAFARLAPKIPAGKTMVAESGIRAPEDVGRLKELGFHAILVGESLLKNKDLESAARALVKAGE